MGIWKKGLVYCSLQSMTHSNYILKDLTCVTVFFSDNSQQESHQHFKKKQHDSNHCIFFKI